MSRVIEVYRHSFELRRNTITNQKFSDERPRPIGVPRRVSQGVQDIWVFFFVSRIQKRHLGFLVEEELGIVAQRVLVVLYM